MKRFEANREFMKSNFDKLNGGIESDQEKKLPQPPLQKQVEGDKLVISLPKPSHEIVKKRDVYKCIGDRRSRRKYTDEWLAMDELSFLLWATQGVDRIAGNNYATIRTVPSGGARHAFETYLAIERVEGLKKGIYRYLALSHELVLEQESENLEEKITQAAMGQKFVSEGNVTFIWSCIPYRSEWRYDISAHKTMLLDAGHLCQNLYLACEAINCGTCAIGAYDQQYIDNFLGFDGYDEFTVYIAPVGKVSVL